MKTKNLLPSFLEALSRWDHGLTEKLRGAFRPWLPEHFSAAAWRPSPASDTVRENHDPIAKPLLAEPVWRLERKLADKAFLLPVMPFEIFEVLYFALGARKEITNFLAKEDEIPKGTALVKIGDSVSKNQPLIEFQNLRDLKQKVHIVAPFGGKIISLGAIHCGLWIKGADWPEAPLYEGEKSDPYNSIFTLQPYEGENMFDCTLNAYKPLIGYLQDVSPTLFGPVEFERYKQFREECGPMIGTLEQTIPLKRQIQNYGAGPMTKPELLH